MKGDLLEFINSKTRKGEPLTEEKAKFLFRQLVLGIAHCHQRNVVHRWVKDNLHIHYIYGVL